MFISPISTNSVLSSRVSYAKKSKPTQVSTEPSFKSTAYKNLFMTYFHHKEGVTNEKIFRELMTAAQRIPGSVVDDIAKVFIQPHEYESVMKGFQNDGPVYKDLSNVSYHRPVWLVRNGDTTLVSIINYGPKGGLWGLFTGGLKEDTRICFHGIDQYKDYVIALGKNLAGEDTKVITKDGIKTFILADL